jgi:aprataxin and PNK-like factor
LIADALREQQKLQQQLKSQKEAAEKRELELEELKTQLAASAAAAAASAANGTALVKGEKEALAGGDVKYFELFPERTHDGTAEQMHFRLAESQFYRLLDSSTNVRLHTGLVRSLCRLLIVLLL